MIQGILDIYVNKGVSIGNYEKPCVESIGFTILDFKSLLSYLDKDKILIKSIELFEKKTLNFIPPDFWYNDSNFDENRKQLDLFMKSLLDLDGFYFVLSLGDKEITETLNKAIEVKYSTI